MTDFNSKFGTFVNGDQVVTPIQLKHGDTVKFGGATSEFVVESKNFNVYTKSQKTKGMFKELTDKFGNSIELVPKLQEALYLVIDDNEQINEVDSDLIYALISCKFIVSPSYFSQLLQNNTMSLGLIQPAIISKSFPTDCWLPRKERLNLLRKAFEGIKRLIFIGGDKNELVIKIIGTFLEIETKSVQIYEIINLKFNELFVISSSICPNLKDLVDPIRTINYQSIIDAVIRCDGKLLEFSTIYPDKSRDQIFLDEKRERLSSFVDDSPIIKIVDTEPISSVDQLPFPLPVSISELDSVLLNKISRENDYRGPSLTAVVPMSATLLRPPQPQPHPQPLSDDSISKKPKFIKCHPRNRLPGTIPALFGPHQLQPCLSINTVINNGVQGTKRRILVKDSWLAEDDLVEEDSCKSDINTLNMNIKENLQQQNNLQEKVSINSTAASSLELTSLDNNSNQQNIMSNLNKHKNSTITFNNTNNIINSASKTLSIPSVVPTSPTPPSSTATGNSKFQSSFFKNLSKGK